MNAFVSATLGNYCFYACRLKVTDSYLQIPYRRKKKPKNFDIGISSKKRSHFLSVCLLNFNMMIWKVHWGYLPHAKMGYLHSCKQDAHWLANSDFSVQECISRR